MVKSIVVLAFVLVVCLMVLNVNAFTDEKGNPCPCATTDDIRRVCGSDGVTYPNLSALNCENQCKKSHIKVRKEGPCEGAAL